MGGLSETRFKERLGDLFHEGYLDRPSQQWDFADARCRPAVHEIGAKAVHALRAIGADQSAPRIADTAHRQFLHALMICELLASVELATRDHGGLRFIGWLEILARAPEAICASITPFRLPLPSGGCLIPDGVFGIEYRAAKSYRFFALEADRGTMPIARSNPKQSSYLGKLAGYGEVIARQAHKTHWGIPNLLVLTITKSAARQSEIVAKLGAGSHAFLFKTADERTLLSPATEILTDPWQRAGHGPLSLVEAH